MRHRASSPTLHSLKPRHGFCLTWPQGPWQPLAVPGTPVLCRAPARVGGSCGWRGLGAGSSPGQREQKSRWLQTQVLVATLNIQLAREGSLQRSTNHIMYKRSPRQAECAPGPL